MLKYLHISFGNCRAVFTKRDVMVTSLEGTFYFVTYQF